MSPEQAAADRDIDTRTDVYALGVLMYELLTGTTPLRRETLREAALAEIGRLLVEGERPKPSTRLSALGADLGARGEPAGRRSADAHPPGSRRPRLDHDEGDRRRSRRGRIGSLAARGRPS